MRPFGRNLAIVAFQFFIRHSDSWAPPKVAVHSFDFGLVAIYALSSGKGKRKRGTRRCADHGRGLRECGWNLWQSSGWISLRGAPRHTCLGMDISILSLALIVGLAIAVVRGIVSIAGLFGGGRSERKRRVVRSGARAPNWEQPQAHRKLAAAAPLPLPPPQDDLEYWRAAHQALQHRMPPPSPPPRPHGD